MSGAPRSRAAGRRKATRADSPRSRAAGRRRATPGRDSAPEGPTGRFPLPFCLFKALFGIPCPGCGLTRAHVALLRGDVRQALYFHPLFWMVPVGAVLVAAAQVKPSLKPLVLNKGVGLGALSVFLGVWLARLAGLFPGVATRRW